MGDSSLESQVELTDLSASVVKGDTEFRI